MTYRHIGSTGPLVSTVGLGCLGMSDLYGPASDVESIKTIHAAMEAGITLFDTGDYYGMGHNEMLLREAFKGANRKNVVISVKFGALRAPGGEWLGNDCRPSSVKSFLSYTLRRLGTDYVDIYRPGRVDPSVPVEETAGAIADLIAAGYARHFGLSEAGVATIRKAHAVHPVSDLQIEYSLFSRGIEAEILPACRQLGIGVTAYGVLSRGLLSGHWGKSRDVTRGDFRSYSPRFVGTNLDKNLSCVEELRKFALTRNATVAQLAIAWVLTRGLDIIPLVGSRKREQLAESLGALDLALSDDDCTAIERLIPAGSIAGERYLPQVLAHMDSERRPS